MPPLHSAFRHYDMLTSQIDVLLKLQLCLGTLQYFLLYGALTDEPNDMNISAQIIDLSIPPILQRALRTNRWVCIMREGWLFDDSTSRKSLNKRLMSRHVLKLCPPTHWTQYSLSLSSNIHLCQHVCICICMYLHAFMWAHLH